MFITFENVYIFYIVYNLLFYINWLNIHYQSSNNNKFNHKHKFKHVFLSLVGKECKIKITVMSYK